MTTRIQPWTEPELMDRESVFEAAVEKALIKTMRALASEAREGILTAAATLPMDPTTEGAYSALQGAVMAEWTAQVDSSLYPLLTATFTDSAARVVDGVQAASGIVVDQLTGVYADEVLQYAYNRMVGIGESLWLNIRDQLVEGYNAGESIPQIAERLTQVAGLTTPRALTVARTEIISAANNGSYLQMLDAGFDEAVTKVWLATEDTRTRLSHRHADNQGVDLTGEFNVDIYSGDVKTGTEPMEFPGDPTATPGNIINCRCSLAFDFEEDAEEVLVSAAAFTEKDHPRDKDGKFKKKGAGDKYFKIPDLADKPANTAPMSEKVTWMVAHKWDSMASGQKGVLIKNIDEETWQKFPPELKEKVLDAPSTTSHPEAKLLLEKDLEKIQGFQDEPDDDADTDVPAGRPVGGVDTKTGKALVPGKPVKLRVQLLYNTTFADGAIMAVRKDSGERIVWNENTKKIQRQKLSAAGKYETTEALSRGAAYAAWKDENGWTVPDASDVAAPSAPQASPAVPQVAVGKPVKIKVQLIYQTPFDDGDIVAVNPSSGDVIKWDAKKKRMVVHHAKGGTTEYTRGALYKEYKDSDGWHLPADKKAPIPAPAPAKKAVPPAAPAAPDPIKDFLGLSQMEKNKIILSMSQKDWDGLSAAEQKAIVKDADHWDENLPTDAAVDHLSDLVKGAAKKDVPPAKSAKPKAAPAKKAFTPVPQIGGENNDKLKAALDDPEVLDGTVLFEINAMGQHTVIKKSDDGIAEVVVNGGPPVKVYSEDALSTENWLKAIVDSKKGANDVLVQTGTDVSDYVASDASNEIYQAWDTTPPGEIYSDGDIGVSLAKNGNLLFLDTKPNGGVGIVKSADVNSENIDKALTAVKAGKTWTVDDAIPEVDPDEISAPGPSQSVSAGGNLSPVSFGDAEVDDMKAEFDNPLIGDVVLENADIEVVKVSHSYVKVTHKASGESQNYEVTDLTAEHLNDFAELNAENAPDPAPTSGTYFSPAQAANIQAKFNALTDPNKIVTLYEDDQVQILGTGLKNQVGVFNKGGGFVGVEAEDLSADSLEQALVSVGLAGAPSTTDAAPDISAITVSESTANNIQGWAKNPSLFAGEELFNHPGFKIVKASPGSVVIYPKDSSGNPDTNNGQILFGDEITSQGIQNTLSQMGISGGPSTPLVPSPGPVSTAVDTTPVGNLPNPSSLKATGQTVGTHGGKLYKDPDGNTWLFKPVSTSQKHLALAEVAAGKLHELAGLTTPAMGETTVDGKFGVIQKIIPNVTSPYEGSFNAKTVTQAQALQLQQEHVFDWLVSNHDSNGQNILKDSNGNLIGIDKGQAYKFFGADTLDPSFNPNGHAVPVANQLFQQYIKSPLSVDINNKSQLDSFINKIQAIPDDEFKAILRPYAEAAAKNGTLAKGGPSYLGLTTVPFPANDVEAFLNAAVARKNSLNHTFTEFYKKLDDAADGQAVDWKISVPPTPSPINPPTVITPTIKQKPLKLSQNILAGKPSQGYFDGQVIAEHPSTQERLVWNAKSKKYDIQLQTSSGKWETAYSYNKSAAVANLKDDAGWMTPSTPQVANSGTSAGDPTLAPSIAGAPQVHTLPLKVETVVPAAIAVPKPKISVADLKAQADLSTVVLPSAVKASIWSDFRTKGQGGSSSVTLSSEPKDIFEGLLIAQARHNQANPSAPLSLLQVLRLADVIGTEKAVSSVNQNLYENKIVNWLKTPDGLQAAQKISDNLSVPAAGGSGGLTATQTYNAVLKKFQEHQAESLKPTAGWKAAMAALPPFQIKAHTPGQTYPEVTTTSQGNKFGADMIAKYGKIPAESKTALRDYTGNDYGAMNAYLRSFGKSSSSMANKAKDANAGLRPSPRALTVHRNSDTVFDANWKPTLAQLQDFKGVVFTEDAFASTSNDGHTFNGKKYRFIIEVPEGTPIAWVDEFSKNSGETEFILGAGLKYEILEITGPGTGTGVSTAHKTAVIRMRVVP